MKFSSQELGRIVHFAEKQTDAAARNRLSKRLVQDRRPSTQASSGAWVNWNYMAEVLGQPFDVARIPLSKLEQMRRDPMLAFGMMFIKAPLISAPWVIKGSDAQRNAFIDFALRKIYGRFILAYTNSFDFGFSPMVKRFEFDQPDWEYEDADSGEKRKVWDKGVDALVWKPFLALSPRGATPHWNYKGEFAGIDFTPTGAVGSNFFTSGFSPGMPGSPNKVADIPLDWALWATNEKDSVFGSYWGYPRIGYAYRYWWSYWYKFGLADRAFEKWADPPVIVYHPGDDEAFDADGNPINLSTEALNLAEQLRSGANASLPSTVVRGMADDRPTNIREWQAEQMESKANFEALNQTFEYLDVQKLRSLMVPEQALVEGKGGSSSRNVAETFGDLFQSVQMVVMQEIDDHLNRFVIPQLLEANFGPSGPTCTKVTTGFDPQDIETMRTIVGAVANKDGALDLPVDIRKLLDRLGIPVLSHAAFQRELDRRIETAQKAQPQPVQATDGPEGRSAGVTKSGLYYDARERIDLSNWLVERVDDLPIPENPPAVLDPENKTVYVRKDATSDDIRRYVLAEAAKDIGESPNPDQVQSFLEQLDERMAEFSEATRIKEEPKKTKTRMRIEDRDEAGNIRSVVKEEIPDDEDQS